MRGFLYGLIAVSIACSSAWAAEAAEDSSESASGLGFECSGTYASWYSFQGFDYSDRKPVVQPEAKVSLRSLSVALWGNLDQATENLNELDTTVRWDWEHKKASGGAGYVNLRYPTREGWEPSQELFVEGALDGPVQASANLHWDVQSGRGAYGCLGLGHEIERSSVTFGVEAKLYAQTHYYGLTGISAAETRLSLRRTWAGMEWEPALSRIWTWENGDFRAEDVVVPGWLVSLSFSPP